MASASKGYFGLSEEATPGVAVSTPEAFYPVQSVDFPYEKQYIDNYEIRGSRQALSSQPGVVEGTASISGVMYPSGAMGKILRGLFGDVTSAKIGATTSYEHSFKDSATGELPYYTLERADAFAAEGGMFAERLSGAKVESMSIECPFGDLVTFTTNFQSIKAPKLSAPVARPATPWPATKPVTFTGASIKVDGVANSLFTNLSMEFTNNLQRQNTLNGTNESYKIFEGGLTCTLNGSAVFETLELRNKLEAGTQFVVEFEINNGVAADTKKQGFRFKFNKVMLSSVSLPMQANEVITSDVTFRVEFDDASKSAVQAYMVNLDTGTDYI
jgi:hypothetical protein